MLSSGDVLVQMIGFVLVVATVFAIPLTLIMTHHKRKMLELQLKMRGGNDETLRASVEALREEVRALRDTTMQYDLSFDAALQTMEQRFNGLERQTRIPTNEAVTQNLTLGGRS